MVSRTLWNNTSDESFHSDELSEIDFMYSTKESENKDVECISCNENFSEDVQGEIWIKCFSWTLPDKRKHSVHIFKIEVFHK